MCSIIGSFSKEKIFELDLLNLSRGNFSYSIAHIDPATYEFNIVDRGFDTPELTKILDNSIFNNKYIVLFRQAPTNGLVQDENRIHPAHIENNYLYHNGIVKTKDLKRLEKLLDQKFEWDTFAILSDITKNGLLNSLNFLDASFACLYIKDKDEVLLFRNQSSIIYYDDNLNISSSEFYNSYELPINKVFSLNLINKEMDIVEKFKNIEDRYFFAS